MAKYDSTYSILLEILKTIGGGGSEIQMQTIDVSNTTASKKANLDLITGLLFEKVESVRVIGVLNGVEYDTIGVYYNGYVTATQKSDFVVFNISFNDGGVTVESSTELDKALSSAHLQIGDTPEIKAYNLENLPADEFLVQLESGFGVGTFQPTTGGKMHITNAYGNEVFYDITTEGAITPDRDYIKPNEPYTVVLDASQIGGSQIDEVTASKIVKCGEIIVNGATGPITYTRAADSTKNMIYFTDSRKDKQMALLTFLVNQSYFHYSTESVVELGDLGPGAYTGFTLAGAKVYEQFSQIPGFPGDFVLDPGTNKYVGIIPVGISQSQFTNILSLDIYLTTRIGAPNSTVNTLIPVTDYSVQVDANALLITVKLDNPVVSGNRFTCLVKYMSDNI